MKKIWYPILVAAAVVALSGTTANAATPSLTGSGWDEDSVFSGDVLADTDVMTVREGNGWVSFEYKDELAESEHRVHEGKPERGGCAFSGSRTITPGTGVISVEREIATNVSDCIMVTEVGLASETDLAYGESEGFEEHAETPAPSLETNTTRAVTANASAWHRTRYIDPPGLTVTRTTTNVSWTYSGGCVTGSSGHTADYYWLGPTGWVKTGSNIWSARDCASALTGDYSYYENSVFCVGQPTTYTYYTPNRIFGNSNGTSTPSWSTWKDGGCNSWLTFQSHSG